MSGVAPRPQRLSRLIISLAMGLLLASRFTIACEAAVAAAPQVDASMVHDCEGGSAPVDHPATKLSCAGVCAAIPDEQVTYAAALPVNSTGEKPPPGVRKLVVCPW